MSRTYTKKSEYWNNRKIGSAPIIQEAQAAPMADLEYSFDDKEHYSQASCDTNTSRSMRGPNGSTEISQTEKFRNINATQLPFALEGGGTYSISDILMTVYRAYFNVQVIRNYINMMADFSKSTLHINCSNRAVKDFFYQWFDVIKIEDLMSEYFLEYYRSGNVFLYKFNGKIQERDFETLKASFGSKKDTLPIRYILLNPMQVQLQNGPGFRNNWVKALSKFEVARLKDPQTPEDKQILNDLPEATKQLIKSGGQFNYVYIPLDTSRLYYIFYKKQNYEPFAVPPIYGVLNDVEWKLDLKRMDLALSKTIEQVILLVTTGDKPDQYSKGTNPKNLERLQNIFKNQSIGRVLVGDYSTKAQWVIPDLKELLGKEKYERVDQDIKDGLQYMFFGGDKFANASIKVKMFMEALREGRDAFLNKFLIPEAIKIVEAMNFKHLPTFEFEDIKLEDNALMNKVYLQMAQLGLLTQEETINAIETGILPTAEESKINQAQYIKDRDNGLYFPLIGGSDKGDESANNGRPAGSKAPQLTKKVSPIGTKASMKEEKFSVTSIIDMLSKGEKVKESIAKVAKKKWKIKKISEAQESVIESLAKSIILNEQETNWETSAEKYFSNPTGISKECNASLDDIAIKYDVDGWTSVILYKSMILDDVKKD